ncbi:hypothetical protein [Nocardia abscessus]|uniref:hypothetical protein n=1 Tax=Nocardia abscessus TaxID=120957 RepID=UPI0024585F43|nr:hypothetical protein [Nocardia abscessus]
MADWITELVEWQIQQGIRRGEYKPQPRPTMPKPPPARTVSYSALTAQPSTGTRWITNFRQLLLTFGRR